MISQSDRKNSTRIATINSFNEGVILQRDIRGTRWDLLQFPQGTHRINYQNIGVVDASWNYVDILSIGRVDSETFRSNDNIVQFSAQTAWGIFVSSTCEARNELLSEESVPEIAITPDATQFILKNRLVVATEIIIGILKTVVAPLSLKSISIQLEEDEDYDQIVHSLLSFEVHISAGVDQVAAWDDSVQRKIVERIKPAHQDTFSVNYVFH